MQSISDRDGWFWLDGVWLAWRDARMHLLTHTLHYGMGCFEGVRAYEGPNGVHLFRADAHVRRLLDSAHALDIPLDFDAPALLDAQREALRRNALGDAYLKPTVFLGAEGMGLRAEGLSTHVMIPAWHLAHYISPSAAEQGLRVLTSSWSRHHVNISLCRAKTNGHYVNSMLALNTAIKAGFDETLMLDPEGYVAEGSAENVFLVRDGVLHTPEVTSCLQGITRDSVIALARERLGMTVRERRITRDELYTADEAFFTGTAAEILPIRELDGRRIGRSDQRPVTRELQGLYRRLVRGDLAGDLAAYGDWLQAV
ncbi:branched-chain amino acid transaminase [Halomonas sp. IOP_31]|uniref:branched-chain amino acid transaminase n=1 Tax=Halomonas sp. IOP_31 TaxID=2876584 RepID=UPI001E2F5F4B|nr:branched-chain amino acid transaminase [Halomonas sp. IOP_31]MCD6006807.1 branched-chain amino acid transaminase [Halomonas sp. IOP_31]